MGQYILEWKQQIKDGYNDEWRYMNFNIRKHRDDFLLRLVKQRGINEIQIADEEDWTEYMEVGK